MKSLLLTPFVLHTRPVASRALSDLDTVLPTQNKTKRPAHPLGLADKMASSSSLAMLLRDLDTGVVGDGVVAHSPLAEPNAGIQTARDLNVARYCEILGCIEDLILDHILHDHSGMH